MSDKLTPEKRSWNMSRIKGKDTKIEVEVRKYLFSKDIASERMIKDIPVSRILSYQSIMWLYLFMAAFGIGMKAVKMRQHQKRERNFGLRSLIKMSKTTR